MKKAMIGLFLPVIFFASCSKSGGNRAMSPGGISITGKWNVDSVTTYFYNATGLLDSSEVSYPLSIPGIYYPLYFKFNDGPFDKPIPQFLPEALKKGKTISAGFVSLILVCKFRGFALLPISNYIFHNLL